MTPAKLLVITGPTAVGKTSQAVSLARLHQGELISADSRQIYQGLDILSGKDLDPDSPFIDKSAEFIGLPSTWQAGYRRLSTIPVWLVDLLPLSQSANVFVFTQLARQLISHLWTQHRLPIIVGGSGQYIHHLLTGFSHSTPPNLKLRAELSSLTLTQLQARLDSLSPASLNPSDRANPRRLIRAIERAVCPLSSVCLPPLSADILVLVLYANSDVLRTNIHQRVSARLKAGVEAEVKQTPATEQLNSQAQTTLGWPLWQAYLAGQLTRAELVSTWQSQELAYAKRQLTYLKKYFASAKWIDISASTCQNKLTDQVNTWLLEK